MLKAQLKSKIAALGSEWQDVEDILTGDFFGVLDYLPRQPFLCNFIEWITAFNPDALQLDSEGVDWESIEFIFWPRIAGEDEAVEPDVVIISNRWVLVVEVKLDSGLGVEQPWREYCIGRDIAMGRRLPADSVFYLLVTRHQLDVADTFDAPNTRARDELLAKTSHLLWHQAVALIERWLKQDQVRPWLRPEQQRLLRDLLEALRRRRSIAFSGFEFINQDVVVAFSEHMFCPDRFSGFLPGDDSCRVAAAAENRFLARFGGFSEAIRIVAVPFGPLLQATRFTGFLERSQMCSAMTTFGILSK